MQLLPACIARASRLALLLAVPVALLPGAAAWAATERGEAAAAGEARPARDAPPADFLRDSAAPVPVDPADPRLIEGPQKPPAGRMAVVYATYAAGYVSLAHVGTRLGVDGDYQIRRLESAYMYDVFGHVFFTRELGLALGSLNRWAGMSDAKARRAGAWYGAFGMQTLEEILNGFMPTARLDPIDIVSNAVGAWWADGGEALRRRSPLFARFSLQYGVKSVQRVFTYHESNNLLGNYWHDYVNGRWGLGFDVGPADRRWLTLLATYEITSMDVRMMQNRFGLAVELPVFSWLSPMLRHAPGGTTFLSVYEWIDRRLMLPMLTVQLMHVDIAPFSNRQPFRE
jgi:hypothetical protein